MLCHRYDAVALCITPTGAWHACQPMLQSSSQHSLHEQGGLQYICDSDTPSNDTFVKVHPCLQKRELQINDNGAASVRTIPSLWADPQAATVCSALLLEAPVNCNPQKPWTSSSAPGRYACHVSHCLCMVWLQLCRGGSRAYGEGTVRDLKLLWRCLPELGQVWAACSCAGEAPWGEEAMDRQRGASQCCALGSAE